MQTSKIRNSAVLWIAAAVLVTAALACAAFAAESDAAKDVEIEWVDVNTAEDDDSYTVMTSGFNTSGKVTTIRYTVTYSGSWATAVINGDGSFSATIGDTWSLLNHPGKYRITVSQGSEKTDNLKTATMQFELFKVDLKYNVGAETVKESYLVSDYAVPDFVLPAGVWYCGDREVSGLSEALQFASARTLSLVEENACEHEWDDPAWSWSADRGSASVRFACALCGYTEDVEAAVTSEGEGDKAIYTATAEFLGKTYTDSESSCQHEWGEWKTTVGPTCEKDGERSRTCALCGVTKTEPVRAEGHQWGEWKTVKEATCTDAGESVRTCSACGEKQVDSVKAYGHAGDAVPAVPATCTEPGLSAGSVCSVCGAVLKAQTATQPLGHSLRTSERVAPSGGNPGQLTSTCTRCGETQTSAFWVVQYISGSTLTEKDVIDGEKAVAIPDPTEEGKVFDGWFLKGVKYDFDTPVTSGILLVAQFSDPVPESEGGDSTMLIVAAIVIILIVAAGAAILIRKRKSA